MVHINIAYIFNEKDGNRVVIVNVTDNSYITIVRATQSQQKILSIIKILD